MSKPMVVTLPFVMLLWTGGRFQTIYDSQFTVHDLPFAVRRKPILLH